MASVMANRPHSRKPDLSVRGVGRKLGSSRQRIFFTESKLLTDKSNISMFFYFEQNMEEIVLAGKHSFDDVRIVNSYPSKVLLVHVPMHAFCPIACIL
jgi:hypothetical protein